MYKDDLKRYVKFGFEICFGITNTSVQISHFAVRIFSVKTVTKYLWKLKILCTKLIYIYHVYCLHSMR